MEIFCFFIGILYAYTHQLVLLMLFVALYYVTPRTHLILFLALGVALVPCHQWLVRTKGMPSDLVISNALIEGTIASIPVVQAHKTSFIFAMNSLNNKKTQALLQLSWYNQIPTIHAGERWQLHCKLKRVRNFNNPGSYDYVHTLASKHIEWTGYIRSNHNQRLSSSLPYWSLLAIRERLNNALFDKAPNERIAGIIQALTLNMTNHISPSDWDLFRRTGTTHLFGISGEHIALLSGLFFFLVRWLWSCSATCCLKIPAHAIASACGFCVAFLYAFLAGFAPPVQRALVGCFLYTLGAVGIQRYTPWQVWRYALFAVLCFEPHAVFMQGFYFSFLAVVCLLLTHQRWALTGYKGNLALQLSCLIGLMPLTLHWFSYGSLNGFIANIFAIPLVGLLIVPLALGVMLFSTYSWSHLLMIPLSWLIERLFQGLSWTEQLAAININWPLSSVYAVLLFLAALLIWILLPIKQCRYIALLWFILPFFPKHTTLNSGEVLIQVLDVGQGLAVHIQTQNHALLYDTGDQFFQGGDLGQMVILPFYKTQGIKKLDAIVISHPDKDHRGGLKSIEAALPVNQLIVNQPSYYHRGINCHQMPAWTWDDINFRFFPIHHEFNNKNNNSCILQISNTHGRVLLVGDIEKQAEEYLVQHYGQELKSEVLIVPHHGSKTSSSYRFLLEVSPLYAIASLGFDNRFHFPHQQTLSTLQRLHIPFFRTDECGMTEIKISKTATISAPNCYKLS